LALGKRCSRFRQRDITKAIKGVVAAGVEVAQVRISATGDIVVLAGKATTEIAAETRNEWDDAVP
jgi:hypothetical protein